MQPTAFKERITQAAKPVVVDFWAPWCAPCRLTKPTLEKLAAQYAGRVEFIAINVDEAGELAQQLGILGIPTLLIFHNGVETSRIAGAQNESRYAALFEASAKGETLKLTLPVFDRLLRLGAAALLLAVGVATGNWLVVGLGGLIAFLGVYDRCPVWRALSGALKRGFTVVVKR